jgi:hypothetical protein
MVTRFFLSLCAFVLLASSLAIADQAKLMVKQHPTQHIYDFASGNSLKLSEFKDLLLAANGFSINKVIFFI